MNALAFLLGSRAIDLARSSERPGREPDEPLKPLATTPETAAAWRCWSEAAHVPIDPGADRPAGLRPRSAAVGQASRNPS